MSTTAKSPAIRRVAVIGAGPIGISTAKYLVGEQKFTQIDVFEQQSSFGGAWIWTQPERDDKLPIPQTNPFGSLDIVHFDSNGQSADIKPPYVMTPMYDNLETNIPHVLMMFSDKQFPDGVSLCPSRTTVLKYIEEYGADIKHLVKFGTQVTRLRIRRDSNGQDLWGLRSKDLVSGRESEGEYDAVALANGHFALPSLPKVVGIKTWNDAYPGAVMHAKWFRNAKQFTGKKVVIVGNASSGIDIGSQIATECDSPIIISARSEPLFKLPDYVKYKEVPNLLEFIDPQAKNRAVRFNDGTVEENVDVVLYCTGYFMSFPFLDEEMRKDLTNTGYMVHGTYKHLFWKHYPSIAFMGLPNKVLPLPLGEAQAAVVARVWSGRLELPSKAEMNIWELERWRSTADLLKSRGKSLDERSLEKAFHALGNLQDLDYHNDLIAWADRAEQGAGRHLPHAWNEKEYWLRSQMAAIKKAFADLRENKGNIKTLEDLGFDYEKHKAEQEKTAPKMANGVI